MTHYWWMHWFWITLVLPGILTASLPEGLHPALTELSTLNSTLSSGTSSTIAPVEPFSTVSPTNVIYKSTKKLKLLLSSPKNVTTRIYNLTKETKNKDLNSLKNVSTKIYNTSKEGFNKDLTVIKTNLTRQNVSEEVTTTACISFQNETENVTYLGEDLNWNQSLVQNSERIGIEERVLSSEPPNSNLSAAGITGITLGCVVVVGVICGVTFFFYKYHRFNRPQVLNDRCSNPDSSGYIDDASVRDNSEEMYSLDNDSFLNSLEAMTIQNYWTDTVKHTKL